PPIAGPVQLQVKLLVNARDHHGNVRTGEINPLLEGADDRLEVVYPGQFNLYFRACGGTIKREHIWIEDFYLTIERERGLPDRDNHLCVGQACLELSSQHWVGIVASLQSEISSDLEKAMERFQAHDLGV